MRAWLLLWQRKNVYSIAGYSSARAQILWVIRPHEEGQPAPFGGLHAVLDEVSGDEALALLVPRFREAFGVATGSLVGSEEASGASGDFGDPFTRRAFFVGESVTEAEEGVLSSFFSTSPSCSAVSATERAELSAASEAFFAARRRRAAWSLLFRCRSAIFSRAS